MLTINRSLLKKTLSEVNKIGTLAAFFIGLWAAAPGQTPDVAGGEAPVTFHSQLEKDVFSDENASFTARLMSTDASANEELINDFNQSFQKDLDRYKKKLRRSASEQYVVRHVFYSVHRKVLKRYHQYVSFANTASTGKYDCLTASTLYAMYLSELQFDFDVVETEYHIYLKVYTPGGVVLLESTDPLEGYVVAEEEIKRAESNHAVAAAGSFGGVANNQAEKGEVINRAVTFTELVGLHYYNQAIAAWNNHNISTARALGDKAYLLYPCERMASLKKLFTSGNPQLLACGNVSN